MGTENTGSERLRGETTGSHERPAQRLTGPVMVFDLRQETAQLKEEEPWSASDRNGKTLAKEGGLSVTLTALKSGHSMPGEHVDGHLTVHVIRGRISLRAADTTSRLNAGFVAVVDWGVLWDIVAEEEAILLLTVSRAPEPGSESPAHIQTSSG
jgi:quercetin dioxygenase-like cupin family protein